MPRAQSTYLGMNQNLYAPFKDKRVREAVSLRDRPATPWCRGLYGGAAFPLNGVDDARHAGLQSERCRS